MAKIKTKQQPVLQFAAPLALTLLFLTVNLQKTECLGTAAAAAECNATRIADCLTDDEEFPMESEANRRILQAGRGGKTITYPVQNPTRTHCDRNVYGSCIGKDSKFYKARPCNYYNTCNRPGN